MTAQRNLLIAVTTNVLEQLAGGPPLANDDYAAIATFHTDAFPPDADPDQREQDIAAFVSEAAAALAGMVTTLARAYDADPIVLFPTIIAELPQAPRP